jgi:hypothetical protein
MAGRVLVTIAEDADPQAVTAALNDAGATGVIPPRPELPRVAVVDVSDDVTAAAERFRAIDGVAQAEPDQLRWSQ